MASITREAKGRYTIQFVGADRKRRSIRLGKVSELEALTWKANVEALSAAIADGRSPDLKVIRWAAELEGKQADKLAAVKLVPSKERATVAGFTENYVKGRTDAKPSTKRKWESTRRALVKHFGPEKLLREVTAGDADEFRLKLIDTKAQKRGTAKLAQNTIRKHLTIAKLFFGAAVRRELIARNPFAGFKTAILANRSRDYFVTREEAGQVLDACPDAEWQLIFALSRYGGLRCPSEHLGLRWVDVNWARERMIVHSPKTEHHEGGDYRVVPIFPELRPYLEEVWEQAEPETEYVITRYRNRNQNLRTQLLRIIKRAGLKPWPKLFQNLRASRETELQRSHPMHVVCAWIGNSPKVAAKHYLQVTEEDFTNATTLPGVVQKAVHAPGGNRLASARKGPEMRAFASPCDGGVTEMGLEPILP